jgi:hypothetical protein
MSIFCTLNFASSSTTSVVKNLSTELSLIYCRHSCNRSSLEPHEVFAEKIKIIVVFVWRCNCLYVYLSVSSEPRIFKCGYVVPLDSILDEL